MREETENKIAGLLVEHLGVAREDVVADVRLVPAVQAGTSIVDPTVASLGADSLDVVELVMAIEEEFAIAVPDDEAEKLNEATFAELVDYVEGKLQPTEVAA